MQQNQKLEQLGYQKTINIATTPEEKARDYARQRFKEFNVDLRNILPDFNRKKLWSCNRK